MNIKGTEYEFILNIDTSSPCSNCAFLRRSDLGCNFPKDVKKNVNRSLVLLMVGTL